jgi:ankyrin repeat protein
LSVDLRLAYDFKTKNGRNPMHTACLHGHLGIVRLFFSKLNFDQMRTVINATDTCGNTPFSECLLADHVNIAEFILENYETCIDLKHKDKLENGFVHLIAQSGSLNALRFLFQKYYDTLEPDCLIDRISANLNRFKMTPLHSACKNNKPDIVGFILSKIEGGNVEKIKFLLISQKDEHNRSAIEIAKSGNFIQIIDLINKYL